MGCHPNPIDFHSIIFQDGEIAPPTRLVYGTEKNGFFVGENLAGWPGENSWWLAPDSWLWDWFVAGLG